MSTINHAYRLIVLLIVLMFALSGCGMFNQPDSPERAEESSATLAEPGEPETSLAVEEPAPAADEAPAAGEMAKESVTPAEEVEVVEAEEAPVEAVAEEEMAVERDGDDAIAAAGGVMLLSEPVTLRLAVSSAAILGGIGIFIASKRGANGARKIAAGGV